MILKGALYVNIVTVQWLSCVHYCITYILLFLSFFSFRILEVKTGKRVYPLYNIRITNPIFDNRENFERLPASTCTCKYACNNDVLWNLLIEDTIPLGLIIVS